MVYIADGDIGYPPALRTQIAKIHPRYTYCSILARLVVDNRHWLKKFGAILL